MVIGHSDHVGFVAMANSFRPVASISADALSVTIGLRTDQLKDLNTGTDDGGRSHCGKDRSDRAPTVSVIFLDFDGVLVTPASALRRSTSGGVSDPDAVKALNVLVAETGALLVITSTWRLEYSPEELAELLKSWDVQASVTRVHSNWSLPGRRDRGLAATVRRVS